MKFIDFFSGIGGFRLGMEMAGHECLGHCEIDKYADISYRAMHNVKEDEWYANDITRIEPGELPEADCYCGGFPCQSFSIAGKRGGFADTRGALFFEVMRLAAVRKPKYLFLENVRGLLSHDGGTTFGTIIAAMGECGYDAEWQVLNSKDFGVPQNRERVFIIGHLRGAGGRKVFPIRESDRKIDGVARYTTGTLCARTGTAESVGTYIIESEQLPQEMKLLIGGSQGCRVYDPSGISCTLAGAKTELYAIPVLTPDRPEKRQNGRRFKEDGEPMFTLTAQDKHGVMVKEATNCNQGIIDNCRIRKLTPKECFRLQGFPDEYFHRAEKVNSNSQLYKQAGNSVTVNVIYEIAKRFK